MMDLRIVYLQAHYSLNTNPLKGVRLWEAFQRAARRIRLSHMVVEEPPGPDEPCPSDFITRKELQALSPDVLYIEGGISGHLVPPIGPEELECLARRGTVVVIADADWNEVNQNLTLYKELGPVCGVTFQFESDEPSQMGAAGLRSSWR